MRWHGLSKAESGRGEGGPAQLAGHVCEAGVEGARHPEALNLC